MTLAHTRFSSFLHLFLSLAVLTIAFSISPSVFGAELKVSSFSPEGMVSRVRQVRAVFDKDAVVFGVQNDSLNPFEVTCSAPGTSRWIDTKTWVYEFRAELSGGANCTFVTQSRTTTTGHTIKGGQSFVVSTGGISILESSPRKNRSGIHEDQTFILGLDGEVDLASVGKEAYFIVDGIESKIPVKILEQSQAHKLAKKTYWNEEDLNFVAIQAGRRFASGKTIQLFWPKGIKSLSGVSNAQDQVLKFTVREPFTSSVECTRAKKGSACSPLSDIRINFSEPISSANLKKIEVVGAEGKPVKVKVPEWQIRDDRIYGLSIAEPHAPLISYRISVAPGLVDVYSRPLQGSRKYPMDVGVADYPPLAKFSSEFGLVEFQNGEGVLPLTVRKLDSKLIANQASVVGEEAGIFSKLIGRSQAFDGSQLSEIVKWMQHLDLYSSDYELNRKSIFKREEMKSTPIAKRRISEIPVPRKHKAGDFEVVGIPFKNPGFYVYEVESRKLLEEYARSNETLEDKQVAYIPTSALVTNLSVHLKYGPENALVWVTQLDKGIPVPGAKVEILDCHGKSLWNGQTNRDGIAMVARSGLIEAANEGCKVEDGRLSSSYLSGLFAFAQKDKDLSFVHSSWKRGLESWRFNSHRYNDDVELVTAHTMTDRSIYMPSDRVHMKHFYRNGNSKGFELEKSNPWKFIQIRHSGSDTSYYLDATWDPNGSALNDWEIPKKASLGRYQVYLSKTKEDDIWNSINVGWFQVEEFKIPLTSGSLTGPKTKISHVDHLDIKAAVRYLAGGSAAGLDVKVENRISAAYSLDGPKSHEEFSWNQGPADSSRFEKLKATIQSKNNLVLDSEGESTYRITGIPKLKTPVSVRSETTYKDPSGEYKTLNFYKEVYPSSVQLGVKSHSWIPTDGNIDLQIAAFDLGDQILAEQDINVDIVKRETVSHRKKLVGGVYGYENKTVFKNLGRLCAGKTDAKGIFVCKVKTKQSGNLYVEVSSQDSKGRTSFTHMSLWIPGEDDWWFGQKATDRMDVIPEKKDYKIGETAKFQVKMPYRQAQALVTVEREGVLSASVQNLSGKGPIVEILVKENYSPNVHIGVLAVRGRIGDPPPTAIVDLAKPSFKTGQSEIAVGWERHQLDLSLSTPKKSYKTQESFPLTVKVKAPKGRKLKEVELAVVAVDEGLFELLNNDSWDLLSSMMRKRNNSVESATAQLQVVGKRHYGLKALPAGGGGGLEMAKLAADMESGEDGNSRKDFSPVILWQGRVGVNSEGEATIPVKLNDSITAFRLGAIATAGADLFGTGVGEVQATKDLMVFGGASLVSRHGDQFGLEYTLRNSTSKKMDLRLDFQAFVDGQKKPFKLSNQKISLNAGETRAIVIDLKAPHVGSKLRYILKSTEAKAGVVDLLESSQKLISPLQVRTLMSEIKQLPKNKESVLKLQLPPNGYPSQGGAVVTISESVSPMLAGVRDYMMDYGFNCFEQKTSKLIVAGDEKEFKTFLEELPEYLDSNGFLKYFPDMPQGSDVLTSYFLAVTHEKGWSIPEDIQIKMIKALSLFVEGKLTLPSFLDASHLSRRKLDAMEALSRYGAAKAEYINYLDKNPRLWSNTELVSLYNLAQRLKLKDQTDRAKDLIESRLHEEGTLLQFKDHHDVFAWWYMRNNAQDTLRYWLSLLEFGGDDDKSRIVKLLQGSVNMQDKGHWNLTSSNAWGSIAVEKFQKRFEAEKVGGETILKDGAESFA